jgi:hypothetical protein
MIELISITLQLIMFFFITVFPINSVTAPKLYKILGKSIFFCILVNIIMLFFLLLICSFFNFNLNYIFLSIMILQLLLFFKYFDKIWYEIFNKKNFFLIYFFLLLNFFSFVDLAYELEIGWDGLDTWIFKANNFYNGFNYFDLFVQEISFKQYPHLGTYIWAFFWKNSLLEYEYLGRLFFQYMFVVSIFVIVLSLKNLSNLKTIILIFCLILLSQDYDYRLQGYQDYIIFSLMIFSGKLLQLIVKRNTDNYLAILYLLSVLILPWIKNEGVFYSIFLVILYLITKETLKMKIVLTFFPVLNVGIQSFITKIIYNLESAYQISFNNILLFFETFDIYIFVLKLLNITLYIFHGFAKYPISFLYLFGIFFILIYKKINLENKLFIIFFILQILFIFSVYLLTPHDLIWHLQTSVKRLILHTCGFYLFTLVWVANHQRNSLI